MNIKEINDYKSKLKLGDKFNNLISIKYLRRENGLQIWLFKCDCGEEIELPSHKVMTNGIRYCSKKCTLKGDPNLTSAFKRIFRTYKNRAKYRNLSFTLSIEEFKKIIDSNCFYCNLEPDNISKEYNTIYSYSGIDRLDNNLGYTVKNSVACCKTCNIAKNNLSTEEFKSWIKRLVSFNNKFIFNGN